MKCTICHKNIKDTDYYELQFKCCMLSKYDHFKRMIYRKIKNGEDIVNRECAA